MSSIRPRTVLAAMTLAGAVAVATTMSGTSAMAATASIPIGQSMTGSMTYYNDAGYGACGTTINAATEDLVAVSYQWWTTANPNNDPLCQGISVQVTWNGTTITVPVKDKCPSCDAGHIDLSQTAFAKLAPLSVGVVTGITWKFVSGTTPTSKTGPITGLAGKCIGAAGGVTTNGTAVDLYSCVGDATQQWTLPGDGTIRTAGQCLDVAGGGTADGTKVQLYTCNSTAAQQWVYSSGSDLVNPQANKCLDLAGNSSADFTVTQIWTCTGAANQKWSIPA